MARDMNVPHTCCHSHLFNLDVEDWINLDGNWMKNVIDTIKDTFVRIKNSLCNAAVLRNLTDLVVVVNSKTCWSGNAAMVNCFIHIYEELKDAHDSEDSSFPLETGAAFKLKATRSDAMLKEINSVTKAMQENGISLLNCREIIMLLKKKIAQKKETPGHALHTCSLMIQKSGTASDHISDHHFNNGVAKLQGGNENKLDDDEIDALESLLKTTVDAEQDQDIPDHNIAGAATGRVAPIPATGSPNMAELIKKRKQEQNDDFCFKAARLSGSEYVDTRFIFGSAAEVERLWSIAKHVLTDHRQSMTPLLFEAILFLRINERFWGADTVALARVNIKSANRSDRFSKMQESNNAYIAMMPAPGND
jgi:hypothetical protein